MSEDVANIILNYIGIILCGTFSITNKLNLSEAIDLVVNTFNLDILRYNNYPFVSIEIYSKLLSKFHF